MLRAARIAAVVGSVCGVGVAMAYGSVRAAVSVFYAVLTVTLFVPVLGGLYVPRAARREGLAVFNRMRTDATYEKLMAATRQIWQSGYDRKAMLGGKHRVGVPRGVDHEQTHGVRTLALVLKVLEDEWEHTGMSHEVELPAIFA